jgi:HSP20 family molecular chaperone IbpA
MHFGTEKQNGRRTQAAPGAVETVFTPALDIHETAKALIVEADLPGVKSDNLRVNVKDNVLEIYGKAAWPLSEGSQLLYEEVRQGDFYRSFILSDDVDPEGIVAEFTNGVLRLTLPKAEKVRPRKIEVKVGGQ